MASAAAEAEGAPRRLGVDAAFVLLDLGGGGRLLDDLPDGSRLRQPLDVTHRLSALDFMVGTHSGAARGELKVRILDRLDEWVVFEGALDVASLQDNRPAVLTVAPPLAIGAYLIEVTCTRRAGALGVALYLEAVRSEAQSGLTLHDGDEQSLLDAVLAIKQHDANYDPFDPALTWTPGAGVGGLGAGAAPSVQPAPSAATAATLVAHALPVGVSAVLLEIGSERFLLDDIGEAVRLVQPVEADGPLQQLDFLIATHQGAARGELQVRLQREENGEVVFASARDVAKLADNRAVVFALRPPAPAGRYWLEVTCKRQAGVPGPAVYLRAPGRGDQAPVAIKQDDRSIVLGIVLHSDLSPHDRSGFDAFEPAGGRALGPVTARRRQAHDPCSLTRSEDGRLGLDDFGQDVRLVQALPRPPGPLAAIGVVLDTLGASRGVLQITLRDAATGAALLANSYDLKSVSDGRPVMIRAAAGPLPDGALLLEVWCQPQGDEPFGALRCRLRHAQARRPGLEIDGRPARVELAVVREPWRPTLAPATGALQTFGRRLVGHLDYLFPGRVTGWTEPVDAPLAVHITGERVTDAQAPEAVSWTGVLVTDPRLMRFELPAPGHAHPGLVDDRIVRVEATSPLAPTGGPELRYPLRRRALRSDAFDSFLHRSKVVVLTDLAAMQIAVRARRRVALFAMFHTREGLFPHQRALIAAMKRAGYLVIGINNSLAVSPATVSEMQDVMDGVILWNGAGMDFASWLIGWSCLGPAVAHLNELVFFNDSCFGPLNDLQAMLDRMRAHPAKLLGVTDNWATAYHLQSYFLLFKTGVLHSRILQDWIRSYSFSPERETIVAEGEVGLSQALVAAGVPIAAAYPYEAVAEAWWTRNVDGVSLPAEPAEALARSDLQRIHDWIVTGFPLNATSFFATELLEMGCPLLKKEHFIRGTLPHRASDLRALLTRVHSLAPEAREMIREAARVQSRGVAPPFPQSGSA